MNLRGIADNLSLENLTPGLPFSDDAPITQAHASDLLSDVLAHAPAGGVLLTIQVHMNVIAVAVHAGLRAVIFASGMKPADDVRARAVEEGIALFSTPETTFDAGGKLYAMGLRGKERG
jgi:hypothetical protein